MRVASHLRLPRKQRYPVIITEYMPDNHKKYLSYNENEFLNLAHSIGNATVDVVKHFLSEGKVSEQGYKAYASLTKIAGRYGHDRIASYLKELQETEKHLLHVPLGSLRAESLKQYVISECLNCWMS